MSCSVSPAPVISVRDQLRRFVDELEPGVYAGAEAASLVQVLVEVERLAAAGKALLAARVADTAVWTATGDRSAAHWLARRSGTSVGESAATLTMAAQVESLPDTAAALRAGKLSGPQAREIADAATVNPTAEKALLATAERESLRKLRDEAHRARAAGRDEAERHAAIKASRYLRSSTTPDGAFELRYRDTVDAGADVLAAITALTEGIFRDARRQGRRERPEAYAADALRALALNSSRAPAANRTNDGESEGGATGSVTPARNAKIIVRVDHAALTRGHLEAGETCEIAGIGPVPVATVTAMMNDAFLAAIVTDGQDVASVAHLGRKLTAKQRTAMEWRGVECVVAGCPCREHLEIDHTVDWARTRHTKLDELEYLCPYHHDLKTHHGYRLEPGSGRRRLLPPDHPDLARSGVEARPLLV
jgi:hypothetical protein